jgi:hypothetical protein
MNQKLYDRQYGRFPECSINTDSVGSRLKEDGVVVKGITKPQVKKVFRFDITKIFKK